MGRPPKPLDEQEVVRLHREGWSITSISRRMHCKSERIKNILTAHSVPIRRGAWGERHPRWRGGRTNNGAGYVRVTLHRDDPLRGLADKNGQLLEHRLVMMRSLGRVLTTGETVHHIDGDRTNNDITNLELHHGPHATGVKLVCHHCGSSDIGPEPLNG